jgi:hypothetical protein
VRTAFLGSYGFGNLGDELCLIDALKQFQTEDAWVFSVRPEFTGRFVNVQGWFRTRAELWALKPERIVLGGGGVGFWPSLRDSLHWMYGPSESGREVECHIYNIGVGKITQPEWGSDRIVESVISNCASFTVRDHVSRWLCLEWPFKREPGLTYYPERKLPPDMTLAASMPNRPLLGISITGQRMMRDALERNTQRIRPVLEQYRGYGVVPIVSTNHQSEAEEDDVMGFNTFADLFLKNFDIVMPQMLDKLWWHENMTPLRLKGIISKCDFLLSQRKHNIIHAIGSGVPFVAIHPKEDDSLLRIIYSLHAEIAPLSGFLSLSN